VLPHNTRAELCRYLAPLRVVRQQIRAIEQGRLRQQGIVFVMGTECLYQNGVSCTG
jgi:hypothetical protein